MADRPPVERSVEPAHIAWICSFPLGTEFDIEYRIAFFASALRAFLLAPINPVVGLLQGPNAGWNVLLLQVVCCSRSDVGTANQGRRLGLVPGGSTRRVWCKSRRDALLLSTIALRSTTDPLLTGLHALHPFRSADAGLSQRFLRGRLWLS